MPFSFLQQKGNLAEFARELTLSTYVPHISLDGLVRGVANVRHDAFLSPACAEVARLYLSRCRTVSLSGEVEGCGVWRLCGRVKREADGCHSPAPRGCGG